MIVLLIQQEGLDEGRFPRPVSPSIERGGLGRRRGEVPILPLAPPYRASTPYHPPSPASVSRFSFFTQSASVAW